MFKCVECVYVSRVCYLFRPSFRCHPIHIGTIFPARVIKPENIRSFTVFYSLFANGHIFADDVRRIARSNIGHSSPNQNPHVFHLTTGISYKRRVALALCMCVCLCALCWPIVNYIPNANMRTSASVRGRPQ